MLNDNDRKQNLLSWDDLGDIELLDYKELKQLESKYKHGLERIKA